MTRAKSKSKYPVAYVRPATRAKFRLLAELEGRSNVADQYDWEANKALREKGYDPETLKPMTATAGARTAGS